jgi:YD repeat-containing protein
VEYPDGTHETYIYSRDGRLTEATDRAGNVKTYSYSPAGDMLSVKEYASRNETHTKYKLTRMSYDEAANLLNKETFEVKAPASGQEVTTSTGDRVDYAYDKAGRIIKVLGPNGRETANTYDADGNLVKQAVKTAQGQADIRRFT